MISSKVRNTHSAESGSDNETPQPLKIFFATIEYISKSPPVSGNFMIKNSRMRKT